MSPEETQVEHIEIYLAGISFTLKTQRGLKDNGTLINWFIETMELVDTCLIKL